MLTGKHHRTLDDKGRLSLPPAFRASLAAGAYVGHHGECLGIWTEEEVRSALERLETSVRAGEADMADLRRFASSIESVSVDAQGRIIIPAAQRETLGLGRNVVLIGVLRRGEVWDAERWEAMEAADDADNQSRWL